MAAGVPTSVVVEVNLSGSTWTNISTLVKSWSVRQTGGNGVEGGELTLVLDNNDGRFVPDNPTSTYYPSFVEGIKVRVQVTKGAASSYRFFGFITEITPDFPSDLVSSTCTVRALDVIGMTSRTQTRSMPFPIVARLRTSEGAFYPLDDKQTRAGFSDVFGLMPDLTARTVSSGGEIDAAGDDSFTPDSEPCVKITSGRSLRHATTAFTFSSTGTIAFYFKAAPSASNTNVFLTVRAGALPVFYVNYDGVNEFINCGADTSFLGGFTPNGSVPPDEWHAVVLTYDGTFMYVDVDDYPQMGEEILFAPSRLEFGSLASFSVRDLFIDPGASGGSTWALRYAKSAGIIASTLADQTTYWGNIPNATPSWSSSVTGVTAGGLLTGGRSGLESLNALARSQSGIGYCTYAATSATINLIANPQARPTTVALTVDVEADADGGPSLNRGLAGRVAEVRVQASVGETVVRDTSATASLDSTTLDVEVAVQSDALRRAIGQDIAATSQNAKQRIESVTVDFVTAANDLYSSFFNLTPGERVRVSNLPSSYLGVTYIDGYVAAWTEGGQGDYEYKATLELIPADAPPEGIWDATGNDQRWGFGDGVATNVSSATSGATSVQFQWTGGLTLSTSAGDYPLDLDWNGERVTVTSAPAGGSSPQTLTITRGVAPTVARAHNAGESVDIWNAARWAM